MNYCYYQSPIGLIEIKGTASYICSLQFVSKKGKENTNSLIDYCVCQLEEYFLGNRTNFQVPYFLEGTNFQKQVWSYLFQIEYGKTFSYQEIAEKLGNRKAVRAVANAIGKNPILILIPCHRVIGKDGKYHGYRGGTDRKVALLDLESKCSCYSR